MRALRAASVAALAWLAEPKTRSSASVGVHAPIDRQRLATRKTRRFARKITVVHDRIDVGSGDHSGEMLRRQVRRADDEAPRDGVELDQRERRGQLIASGDEDGTACELRREAAETRTTPELTQSNACRCARQMTMTLVRGAGQPNRRHELRRPAHRT